MVDWSDLLPSNIAEYQRAYEHRWMLYRMKQVGLSFEEIKARCPLTRHGRPITTTYIRQQIDTYLYFSNRKEGTPVERWFNRKGDIAHLYTALGKKRARAMAANKGLSPFWKNWLAKRNVKIDGV